jgi:hypothetical protein
MQIAPKVLAEYSDADIQNAVILEGMVFSGNHLALAVEAALTANHVIIGADLMRVRQTINEAIRALIVCNHSIVQLMSREAQNIYWHSIYFDQGGKPGYELRQNPDR